MSTIKDFKTEQTTLQYFLDENGIIKNGGVRLTRPQGSFLPRIEAGSEYSVLPSPTPNPIIQRLKDRVMMKPSKRKALPQPKSKMKKGNITSPAAKRYLSKMAAKKGNIAGLSKDENLDNNTGLTFDENKVLTSQ